MDLANSPRRPYRLNKNHWLADRLEYWWPEPGKSGAVNELIDMPDMSLGGRGRDMTVSLATNPVVFQPTIFGNAALEFNNTSHVGNDDIPVDRINNNIANGPFTWATWIKAGSYTSNDVIFSIRNGGSTTEVLIVYAFDNVGGDGFDVFFDGARRFSKADPRNEASLNEWHFFAFTTRSATDHVIYIDGRRVEDSAGNANLTAAATNMQIGGWQNSQYANDDQVFGMTVHSRGFSDAEMWAWYNADRWGLYEQDEVISRVPAVVGGRIMSSMAGAGGLAYKGGIAGIGGGLAGCLALLLMWKW